MVVLKQEKFDLISIVIYFILILLGWMSIYSSSYTNDNHDVFLLASANGKQILFIAISVFLCFFILLIDAKIIYRLSYLTYIICILSLVLVLMIGKEVGGAKAWFSIGKLSLQPAEFAKIGTVMAIAKFINDRNIYLESLSSIVKIITFIILPFILILLQPDAGSGLVFGSLIFVFYREGINSKYVISIILIILTALFTIIFGQIKTLFFLFLVTLFLLYLIKKNTRRFFISLVFFISFTFVISGVNFTYENVLGAHQKERIDLIIGKEKNQLGSGYNLNQSLIAIGSGQYWGKGYLNGTQTKGNFIPEQNTDFIFCTIGEEFGFLGSIITLSLFMSLIIRIIILSEKQTSRFSRIIGYSLASILFAHTIINIGMTIGLIPVIGIPLPFFSYGGSSMLAFSVFLAIFLKLDSCRLERF